MTSDDPDGWSGTRSLFAGHIPNPVLGHPTLIGDSTISYLFFTHEQGTISRSSMSIDNFPGMFGSWSELVIAGTAGFGRNIDMLFSGGVQVHTMKGYGKEGGRG
jgi:hypothetical protein